MHMGEPIIPLNGMSDRQWSQVTRIAALLQQEYASRRATLLKRLDVTVQSFKWSDKAKVSHTVFVNRNAFCICGDNGRDVDSVKSKKTDGAQPKRIGNWKLHNSRF
ncbi:Protein FAM98A [Fasciolopsis buskii]|uniref:Protein FAM98A n=1 Tax=Fasciolopsis buskii TaxID=27845 RepID=A0A8E0RM67_9TREM|nr:Protein FAM98A [Fasciolopsis buski]